MLILAVGSCAVLAACGSGTSSGPAGSESNDGVNTRDLPYTPCSAESEVGEFAIELSEEYTSVGGKVWDGVTPRLVPAELMAEGSCRLLSPPPERCTPACAAGEEECSADAVCVPAPLARDVGVVTVAGLVAPVEMRPGDQTKNYTNPGVPALPHPGFTRGANLHLHAAGGDFEAFDLWGWGVTLLGVTTDPIEVRSGMPTLVEWQVPADVGPARVHASLDIDNHGSSGTWIECDVADAGSLSIPAALIDALFMRGRSGFPTLSLARRTATSVEITPGCVELLTQSQLDMDVQVEGITSCAGPAYCPLGQTCRFPERFCE